MAPRIMIAMGICVGLLSIWSKNEIRIRSQSCMYLVTYEASTNASDMSPSRTKAIDPAVMRAIPANWKWKILILFNEKNLERLLLISSNIILIL